RGRGRPDRVRNGATPPPGRHSAPSRGGAVVRHGMRGKWRRTARTVFRGRCLIIRSVQLELAPEAARVLEEVLDRALGDLREEIYKTDTADYKTALKTREAIIVSLLERVKTPS